EDGKKQEFSFFTRQDEPLSSHSPPRFIQFPVLHHAGGAVDENTDAQWLILSCKEADLLLLAVFIDLELFFTQISNVVVLVIGHQNIDKHDLGPDLDRFFFLILSMGRS